MRPFTYARPNDIPAALRMAAGADPANLAPTQFLAGGTTLLDLMKLDVMRPQTLVDIKTIDPAHAGIMMGADGLYLGAFATMAQAGEDTAIRQNYPVIAQSLLFAASPQLRNMATLAGNVLQRTRCNYFRDTAWGECNKRMPGSGCAALHGINRRHAVLGTSDHCIATYAGDFAQALMALDATVEIQGPGRMRSIRFEELHVLPGETPHIETVLQAGEMITGFRVAAMPWARRSLYVKIRDRESYEFALASAAVALDMSEGGVVREARIALGGVATKPWRAREAEAVLQGGTLDEALAQRAGMAAFAQAETHGENAYKPKLGQRTVARALLQAARLR